MASRAPVPGGAADELPADGLRQRRRAHTRAAACDVALRLFAERGYAEVTVADICTAAEIAPRTFFRYFTSKADVLAEPARDLSARTAEYLAAAPEQLSDADALVSALRQLGGHVVADAGRLRLFLGLARTSSDVRSDLSVHLSHQERGLVDQLVRRHPAPEAPDWQTRLLVARTVAAFRVWLDDFVTGAVADPLGHLDEVLAAR